LWTPTYRSLPTQKFIFIFSFIYLFIYLFLCSFIDYADVTQMHNIV
jgi:hypothetical protein